MNDTNFTYSYSAAVNKEVQNIKNKYTVKEESKIEKLKRLDGYVASAGMVQALCIGVIGALIFGIGMCVGLDVLWGGMTLATMLGIIGALVMIPAYPIYKLCQKRAREKYVPEILRLADEISAEDGKKIKD